MGGVIGGDGIYLRQVTCAPAHTDDRWFVAKTIVRRESLAAQHLLRQKFETYLPLLLPPTHARNSGPARALAFFPGYIFVRMNLTRDRWRSVNGTIGVSALLQSGGRPTPVPDGLVESLMSRTDEDGVLGFADPLAPGVEVKVIGGPFDAFTGVFEGLDGPGRVKVLLNLMGRSTTVSLERAAVMAV